MRRFNKGFTNVDRQSVGVNHENWKLQNRAHKAGDVGWTAHVGMDGPGSLAVRFLNSKYASNRFTYIEDRLFSMALADMKH